MSGDVLLSTQQVADILGITPRHVRRLIGQGKLPGRLVAGTSGRTFQVLQSDLERYRAGLLETSPPAAPEGGVREGDLQALVERMGQAMMNTGPLTQRIEDLARQVGRLEAENAALRRRLRPWWRRLFG